MPMLRCLGRAFLLHGPNHVSDRPNKRGQAHSLPTIGGKLSLVQMPLLPELFTACV